MRRSIFGLGMLVATLAAATPVLAADGVDVGTAAQLPPNRFVWNDAANAGPVSIVVSIPDQRAYVYRGGTLVAATTVSTGKGGKDTPTGSYTILQKDVMHKSNLYNAAPMPFMQRLTWDGIAIHAGANPGFPASHGCIRVPAAFAKKLFEVTRVGTTVTVLDTSVDGAPPATPAPLELPDVETRATASANSEQLAALPR